MEQVKTTVKTRILEFVFLFAHGLILYIISYFMGGGTPGIIMNLVTSHGIQYIIVPFLIVLSITCIIKSFIKDCYKTNIITTLIVLIVTIISYYKVSILDIPFLPNDILLIGNIGQIAEFGLSFPPIVMILIIIIMALILTLEYFIYQKLNLNQKEKTIENHLIHFFYFLVGIVLMYSLCISPSRYAKWHIKNDLGDNNSWMGSNAVFFTHLGDLYFPAPEGYNKNSIEKIKQENNMDTTITAELPKPNVILIMNESFTNPNKLKNVKYSTNPIQNIEALEKSDQNCKIGNIITPVFGGGTSLPEFEALTGLSSYFLEQQIFPYTSYIRSDMNSIVREYRNHGYHTVGMHTNTQTFYNRKNVYQYLGFQKTIFSQDIENPEMKRGRISDNEFANQIIKSLSENNGNQFIFGVTMQNHMPYSGKRYEEYDIDVEASDLTPSETIELRNYIQGVYDDDKMFMKIVNYLKEIQTPTILVMFGDHLPALPSYTNSSKNHFNIIDMHSTPYIIWANYDIDLSEVPSYMSPSCLSIEVMKLANVERTWYLKKFEELYTSYPVMNNVLLMDSNNRLINLESIKQYDLVNDCRILQYDLLIKKKYIPIIGTK